MKSFKECEKEVNVCIQKFASWFSLAVDQDDYQACYETFEEHLNDIGLSCADDKIWDYIRASVNMLFTPVTITS